MELEQSISFSVKLKEQDLIRFNFSHFYSRWVYSILTAWMFVVGCLAVITGFTKGFSQVPGLAIFFPAVFVIVLPITVYFGARKSFKNRLVQEERMYVIDSQGVVLKSESIQAVYRWEDFKAVRMTRKAIYLFIATNSALLFPIHAIPVGALEGVKSLTLEKTPKQKKNRVKLVLIIIVSFLIFTGVLRYISNANG